MLVSEVCNTHLTLTHLSRGEEPRRYAGNSSAVQLRNRQSANESIMIGQQRDGFARPFALVGI